MNLHDLEDPTAGRRPRRRVGRGNAGKGGTYAGRGRKGQKARSGGVKKAYFEGGQLPFVRRLPFRRGFNNVFRVEYTPVGLATLSERFEAGAAVTPDSLVRVGLLRRADEPYKILGNGDLDKALMVQAPRFSQSAAAAIEGAGGTIERIEDDYRLAGMGRSHRRQR
jgi:large subunit ribosomal protein L15